MHQLDAALKHFQTCRAVFVKEFGERSERVAVTDSNMASVYNARGETDQACALMESSLAIKRELHGDSHLSVAFGLNNLALIKAQQGNRSEAIELLEQSLQMKERCNSSVNTKVETMLALADTCDKADRKSDAIRWARRALQFRPELGDHVHMGVASLLLAQFLHAQGDAAHAAALQEARAILEGQLPDQHPVMLLLKKHMATVAPDPPVTVGGAR